jgi:hypothetical protein
MPIRESDQTLALPQKGNFRLMQGTTGECSMRTVVFLAAQALAGCAHQEAAQTKAKTVAIVQPDAP